MGKESERAREREREGERETKTTSPPQQPRARTCTRLILKDKTYTHGQTYKSTSLMLLSATFESASEEGKRDKAGDSASVPLLLLMTKVSPILLLRRPMCSNWTHLLDVAFLIYFFAHRLLISKLISIYCLLTST